MRCAGQLTPYCDQSGGRADGDGATETNSVLLVTEVEVPEMLSKLELTDPESIGRQEVLQQLQEFRVEVKGKGKLVRKDSERA
jgi:hypothetical protein